MAAETVYARVSRTKKHQIWVRQKRVLDYITRYIQQHGRSPTQREIGDAMSMSRKMAADTIERLELRGLITRGEYGAKRAVWPAIVGAVCPVCKRGVADAH